MYGGDKRMMIIGLTGGSGTGKSAAAKAFTEFGAHWIDADAVYHGLLDTCKPMKKELLSRFPDAEGEHGEVDRGKLAHIVFSDEEALRALNKLTHPYVIAEIENRIGACYRNNTSMLVIDAIALFESGADRLCDLTVAVIAGDKLRVRRVMERDGMSEQDVRARMASQMPEDEKRKRSDVVIENNGTLEELRAAIDRLLPI